MAFVTTAQLKGRLAAALKVEPSALPAEWDSIVASSVDAGYQEIVGALASRGYSAAQIASWDRGVEFNTDMGLFWALVKGAGLHGNDPTFIDKLDRRKELAAVPVVVGGSLVTPGTTPAVVGYGALDTEDDNFNAETNW